MHQFNNEKYKNPGIGWNQRNQEIANLLEDNKTVLDLGCGYKNLLKHYTPSKYLGVDWFDYADIKLDLNQNFHLQIPKDWDYVVSSGVMEYLDNVDEYLKKVKDLGEIYVFTWWAKPGRESISTIRDKINKHYKIIKESDKAQQIYVCKLL